MTLTIHDIVKCARCRLCQNQAPLLDSRFQGAVFWVGLSAVKVKSSEESPLALTTNSGSLLGQIEQCFDPCNFYRTNLVKCLPLEKGRVRYPNNDEMKSCYCNLALEVQTLKPRLVFLLGRQVASFVCTQNNHREPFAFGPDFGYQLLSIGETLYVPVHHPSHILVFQRKRVKQYIDSIADIIKHVMSVHALASEW